MKSAVALFLSIGLVACAASSSGSGTGESVQAGPVQADSVQADSVQADSVQAEPVQADSVRDDKQVSQDHEPPDKLGPIETADRAVAHGAKQAAADAAKIECARAKAMPGKPRQLSLEDLTNEGGFAEVFERDGEVVRVRGGLLSETSRFRFDYVFADGRLRCAEETVSNVHVMNEGTPGWVSFWHHQHLVFEGDTVLSVSRDHTTGAGDRGRDRHEVREFAKAVLARARQAGT